MLAKLLVRNEGTLDRVIRVVVGIGLLGIALSGPKTPWGFLGIVPLLTGLLGTCPLYTAFGLRTCPLRKPAA